MTLPLRKLALTAHVVASVGWLGAVAMFLALSIAALTVDDVELARAAYLAMELTVWSVLVPFALAALLTGLVQALGTSWGLFRHYWVLAKLLITLAGTLVLLLYTQTVDAMARLAADGAALGALRNPSPMVHAALALALLLAAAALSVYKPRGRTRYGWRKQQERASPRGARARGGAVRPRS